MEVNPFIRKLDSFFKEKEFSSRPVNCDAGLDHLRQLLLEAHREYQEYMATGVMTPGVSAVRFLDGHHYAEDGNTSDKNLHRKVPGAASTHSRLSVLLPG